jgi:hypothetical protein
VFSVNYTAGTPEVSHTHPASAARNDSNHLQFLDDHADGNCVGTNYTKKTLPNDLNALMDGYKNVRHLKSSGQIFLVTPSFFLLDV